MQELHDLRVDIQSLGMIEFNSIASGIEATDHMMKAASIKPLYVKTICPGKFVATIHGEVASVEAAIAAGLAAANDTVVDHFVIANVNPVVVSAMTATTTGDLGPAIGIIETFSASSSILAADAASKAANVLIAEVRIAMGLGGKAYCLVSGDIAAVEAAIEAGAATVKTSGLLVRKVVIPAMTPELMRLIV